MPIPALVLVLRSARAPAVDVVEHAREITIPMRRQYYADLTAGLFRPEQDPFALGKEIRRRLWATRRAAVTGALDRATRSVRRRLGLARG